MDRVLESEAVEVSAIDEMVKKAETELVAAFHITGIDCSENVEQFGVRCAIIARHYREGVRELVLAAREVGSNELTDEFYPEIERLRKALEQFKDME